jgi:chemotaxis protein MotB
MIRSNPTKEIEVRTWQLSFNDLLTLLLTFFILLVAMSEINLQKVQAVSSSAIDVFGATKTVDQKDLLTRSITSVNGITVNPAKNGISIILPESLVYSSGSAEIIHKDILKDIGQQLKTIECFIRVEGHTDSMPISNESFASNWELSIQRAVNVVKFLDKECGIDPRKLSVAGYADSRPVTSNDHSEGRMLNRRVNIIVSF